MELMTVYCSKPLPVDHITYRNHILTFYTLSRGVTLYCVLDLRTETPLPHRVMIIRTWPREKPLPAIDTNERHQCLAAPEASQSKHV